MIHSHKLSFVFISIFSFVMFVGSAKANLHSLSGVANESLIYGGLKAISIRVQEPLVIFVVTNHEDEVESFAISVGNSCDIDALAPCWRSGEITLQDSGYVFNANESNVTVEQMSWLEVGLIALFGEFRRHNLLLSAAGFLAKTQSLSNSCFKEIQMIGNMDRGVKCQEFSMVLNAFQKAHPDAYTALTN